MNIEDIAAFKTSTKQLCNEKYFKFPHKNLIF